jgi:hypothetical protein
VVTAAVLFVHDFESSVSAERIAVTIILCINLMLSIPLCI